MIGIGSKGQRFEVVVMVDTKIVLECSLVV